MITRTKDWRNPAGLSDLLYDFSSKNDDVSFRVLDAGRAGDPTVPLIIVVHPGDAVEKPDDVHGEPNAREILEHSWHCQDKMGIEIAEMLDAGADCAVLHRFSSGYSFVNDVNVADAYFPAIARIHGEGGSLLWGDDLETAAAWINEYLEPAMRPRILLTGAWSDAQFGCVAHLAQLLENRNARIDVSTHSPTQPGGGGTPWSPGSGRLDG